MLRIFVADATLSLDAASASCLQRAAQSHAVRRPIRPKLGYKACLLADSLRVDQTFMTYFETIDKIDVCLLTEGYFTKQQEKECGWFEHNYCS